MREIDFCDKSSIGLRGNIHAVRNSCDLFGITVEYKDTEIVITNKRSATISVLVATTKHFNQRFDVKTEKQAKSIRPKATC